MCFKTAELSTDSPISLPLTAIKSSPEKCLTSTIIDEFDPLSMVNLTTNSTFIGSENSVSSFKPSNLVTPTNAYSNSISNILSAPKPFQRQNLQMNLLLPEKAQTSSMNNINLSEPSSQISNINRPVYQNNPFLPTPYYPPSNTSLGLTNRYRPVNFTVPPKIHKNEKLEFLLDTDDNKHKQTQFVQAKSILEMNKINDNNNNYGNSSKSLLD